MTFLANKKAPIALSGSQVIDQVQRRIEQHFIGSIEIEIDDAAKLAMYDQVHVGVVNSVSVSLYTRRLEELHGYAVMGPLLKNFAHHAELACRAFQLCRTDPKVKQYDNELLRKPSVLADALDLMGRFWLNEETLRNCEDEALHAQHVALALAVTALGEHMRSQVDPT